MRGVVTAVLNRMKGKNYDVAYNRVTFWLETRQWAKTDICRGCRNERFWIGFMKVGTILDGLKFSKDSTVEIDADVKPKRVGFTDNPKRWMRSDPAQTELGI